MMIAQDTPSKSNSVVKNVNKYNCEPAGVIAPPGFPPVGVAEADDDEALKVDVGCGGTSGGDDDVVAVVEVDNAVDMTVWE